MSRRMARETALKCCFAREFNSEGDCAAILELEDENPDITEEDIAYVDEIAKGIEENAAFLDDEIKRLAIGWDIERMPKVDVCIMRIALYEMIFRDDVPEGASINEAVEIAKKFSGDKSAPYINGMLGTFSRERAGDNQGEPE